jgi:hypothetical protein
MDNEIILESNLEIRKCIHQLKFYDVPSNEIIKDIKNIITTSSNRQLCLESLSCINNLDLSDNEQIISSLNTLISVRESYVEDNKSNQSNDIFAMVEETFSTVEKIIYDMYNEIYDNETAYIESLLENLDILMESEGTKLIKDVGTAATKAGKTVAKGANAIWQALLNLIRQVREAFMSKHRKITERDASWLKSNEKTLRTLDTSDMEINIHSDYKKRLAESRTVYDTFSNIVEANIHSYNNYEDFKAKIKQFLPQSGDLKEGLINRYRTGNVNTEYTINTIRGNAIKAPINDLITYCNDFIASFNDMSKKIKDSEAFIKKLQNEVKSRNIATEGYCYVEESLYSDIELAMFYDFDVIFEDDNSSANTGANTNNTTTQPNNTQSATQNNNQPNNDKKDDKVGVTKRNEIKEKTDKMSDDKLSLYNKICRDRHLGLTAYMTATEKKYFESITILRGLIANKK